MEEVAGASPGSRQQHVQIHLAEGPQQAGRIPTRNAEAIGVSHALQLALSCSRIHLEHLKCTHVQYVQSRCPEAAPQPLPKKHDLN